MSTFQRRTCVLGAALAASSIAVLLVGALIAAAMISNTQPCQEESVLGSSGQPAARASAEGLIEVAASSVGLVIIEAAGPHGPVEEPIGTAWVASDEGLLGTAAHVAEAFPMIAPGDRLLVRFPGPAPLTVVIEEAMLHPLYGVLEAQLKRSESPLIHQGWAPAADVALLRVAGDYRSILPPALAIATGAELESMSPLAQIILIGHPLEGLVAQGTAPSSPTPGIWVGSLVRSTDHFFEPGVPSERRLLHVDLPVTGGASGSPILNRQGRVIGIVTAANFAFVNRGRIPLAVGLNFAQRVDWLSELLSLPIHQLRALELRWQEQVAQSQVPDPIAR